MLKDKVKECRKEMGLTQVDFSKLLGISRSYLAEIERGSLKGSTKTHTYSLSCKVNK